jgi:hypothetical protein
MKIRGANGRASGVTGPSGLSSAGQAGPPPAPPAAGPTDGVQLSNLAQMAAFHDSPTHIARLSSLSATVSSGGYQVEAGVLSNSIIEASMQLSGGNYI